MKQEWIELLHTTMSLSAHEARTYLVLFELGEVLIGPLADELGLHKQSVYNILQKLEEKGLVHSVSKKGRKYFVAVDPEYCIQQHKHQLIQLQSLVPTIQLREGAKQHVADISIYNGTSAFQKFHEQQLKRAPLGSCLDVVGAGGDDFLAIMNTHAFFRRYENIRIDRNIAHRLIMYADQKNVDPVYIHRKYVEAKFLPYALEQSPMATQIWPDSVSLLMFGSDPHIVHIRSAKIREGFAGYFRSLWELAR